MPATLSRAAYAQMYGPTVGDRVRLADTELIIEVEKDFTTYGEEVKFGGGKVIRDGMGQSQVTWPTARRYGHHECADRGPLGDRQSRRRHQGRTHRGIGKAGNPDTQPGVDIIIGAGTEVIAAEGKIVTAGGIDTHIHFIARNRSTKRLSGITTWSAVARVRRWNVRHTCTPGPWKWRE